MDIKAKNVSIKPEVDFFGEGHDELVVLINDPDGELSKLNKEIKGTAHQAHDDYKKIHHRDLYDIAKSERYPFLPHMGLGRIRSNSIKQHIKDKSLVNDTFERIKQRIKKAAQEVVKESIAASSSKLSFNKIGVLDLAKQTYIKEWVKG
ncbi:MAG: hypothetical protein Q8Q25_01760 [bacterium]|nr:hypothetical protein [bacterium]